MRTAGVMAMWPMPSVEHFSSGASSSGWMTRKYCGSYEFCRVAINRLALSVKEIGEHDLCGQQQRQGKQDYDDGPVDVVVPRPVHPTFAKQFVVVKKQL